MKRSEIDRYLKLAKEIIKKAGLMILEEKKRGFRVIRKDSKEMVTNLDLLIQEYLKDELKKELGEVLVFSEEQKDQAVNQDSYWSIDPIDGTHNFIAGLYSYGISIAYIDNNELQLGVIYLPESDDLYFASKGLGSFYNKQKIVCSDIDSLDKSIIGYDNQFYLSEDSEEIFLQLLKETFTMRIRGCSVMYATSVANGHLSSRIYNATKLCDVAAGIIIVQESGGKVTNFKGEEIILNQVSDLILSGNNIHNKLVELLSRY